MAVYVSFFRAPEPRLARVSPSFETITFSFHIRIEEYQRSLIVVSTYDDFEMEEGARK